MKNMNVAVSVIIPVYNVAQYLPHTLKCLMDQSFQSFEVICVDDNSSDESYQVLMEYKKHFPKLHVIKNNQNQGAGECRNIGLNAATGTFVLFLDADDEFESSLIENIYTQVNKEKADVVIYYTGHFTDGETTRIVPDRKGANQVNLNGYPIIDRPGEQPNLYELITNSPFDKLVKREILMKHHIRFPRYPHTNDMSYSYESVLCANKVVFLDEVLYFHRRDREGSITTNFSRTHSYIVNVLEDIYKFEKSRGISVEQEEAYWKFALHRIYQALYSIPAEHQEPLLKQANAFLKQYYFPFLNMMQEESFLRDNLLKLISKNDITQKYADILRKSQIENWSKHKEHFMIFINNLLATTLYKRDKLTDYFVNEEALKYKQISNITIRILSTKLRKIIKIFPGGM